MNCGGGVQVWTTPHLKNLWLCGPPRVVLIPSFGLVIIRYGSTPNGVTWLEFVKLQNYFLESSYIEISTDWFHFLTKSKINKARYWSKNGIKSC